MTIESIKPCKTGGFFAMLINNGRPNEMFFDTEADVKNYVAAFNNFFA